MTLPETARRPTAYGGPGTVDDDSGAGDRGERLAVQFQVQRAAVRGRLTLRVRGELDVATAPRLGEAVAEALESGPAALVVDLTDTSFLDSSGARQLARTARHCGEVGVAVQVVCPAGNRPVRMVLDLLELHRAVPVVEQAGLAGGGAGGGVGS